ncbi:MAG: hypothetical protein IKP64_01320 [Selenomonadaceae bacterium]|nr:hypothetical protein [Selenomonadaceae bacterium]
MAELQDRINSFLYEAEHVQNTDVNQYVTKISGETGVAEEDVRKVLDAVLKILEQKRIDNGIVEGQAFPVFLVNRHAHRRRYWGGR